MAKVKSTDQGCNAAWWQGYDLNCSILNARAGSFPQLSTLMSVQSFPPEFRDVDCLSIRATVEKGNIEEQLKSHEEDIEMAEEGEY